MTVQAPERAQPQTKSRETTFLKGAMEAKIGTDVSDDDATPRPVFKTIGLKASTETLKANNTKQPSSSDLKTAQYTPTTPSSATTSSRSSTLTSTKAERDQLAMTTLTPEQSKIRHKFSISRKKKRLQKQAQELEDQRLKEEANEALRRKHGEYHPPGHTPGLIHNHRPPQHHDHQQIERSRSLTNMRQQYQQPLQPMHRYPSTSRIASPTSFSPSSPTSPRSCTSSVSSSTHSSRHNSYTNGHNPQRPTSPMREQRSVQIDLSQVNPHLNDLESLDAEGILSGHWDSNSEDDHGLSFNQSGYRNSSKRSMDSTASESSYQTDQSSINPPSALTRHHRANRSTLSIDTRPLPTHSNHHPSISQQISGDTRVSDYRSDSRQSNHRRGDSRLSNYHENQSDQSVVEMTEVNSPPSIHPLDQSRHQSWPLNGDRLMPNHDPHNEKNRSVSSLSRYPTPARSRDPLVERYLLSTGGGNGSLASTGSPSTTNLHSHRHHSHSHYGRRLSNDMTATEALRAKAGSRATYRTRGDDSWSAHDTEVSQDGHNHNNYLAPLPPFQMGPAYARVPKRKYCKWCCGGCRWWVLLLCILIPAGIMALAAVFLWHHFQVCEPIDPNGLAPMVYMVDPTTIQGIALEYQTLTKGSIRIVDSPDPNEYKVIMRLQRQFYKMENREDLTGFQSEYLPNGYSRYVLDDAANNHRGFFVASALCSTSILTIEMPRTLPGRGEIAIDALIDQQDLTIDLDQTLVRNTTWRIRTLSNKGVVVKSLNIDALTISSTSTTPSSIVLESVVVQNQLSVVSVSGNIQAAVGFDPRGPNGTTTTSAPLPQPTSSSPSSSSAMVSLNTLDGEIQFDLKAWNQTCTFKVGSPTIQVTKAGAVVLDFANSTTGGGGGGGGGWINGTHFDRNGLVVDLGYNSVSGTFKALSGNGTIVPSNATTTATMSSTRTSARPSSTTTSVMPTPTLPGPLMGAGGSLVPAQLLVQANRKVTINFP
ncbi:hypothetical protein MVEG_06507 [Podila verticillata NRRL 6337]|nr:hypothetical protein MVEG_06507 [Podila verticillata NRRL 6337]